MKHRKDLEAKGFKGFRTVAELRANCFSGIPLTPGVYVAISERTKKPIEILSRSPAGWFKGKNPTQHIADLRSRWVNGAEIVYIGKAGGPGTRPDRTLKARIGEFLCFGVGVPCAHWGGRSVWQLGESDDLLIAWVEADGPRSLEKRLIKEFKKGNSGRRPFANMQG